MEVVYVQLGNEANPNCVPHGKYGIGYHFHLIYD